MKVIVGSKNPGKVNAVQSVTTLYDFLKDAEIDFFEVASGVSEQPKSIKEIIEGSRNRAKGAFRDCDLSFGIESGFMEVPYSKTGFMELSACVIFDGKEFHMGLSPAFECPPKIMDYIHKGLNMSEAFYEAGLHSNKDIGKEGGGLGLLTKGRITREDYTRFSIMMALIHLENAHLFKDPLNRK